jgi:hypothetical protein
VNIPTFAQLRPFIADEECYLVAEELEQTFPGLVAESGFYLHPRTHRAYDHGWCVHTDGSIIDCTHGQFVRARPIVITREGEALHRHYHPWSEHHPQTNPHHCLLRALNIPYECEIAVSYPYLGICDYYGREDTKGARARAARARADFAARGPRARARVLAASGYDFAAASL